MNESESLPPSIPANPFSSMLSLRSLASNSNHLLVSGLAPINSQHSMSQRSNEPPRDSIELPTLSSLSLRSHEFFLGPVDDPDGGEMLMYPSWFSDPDRSRCLS